MQNPLSYQIPKIFTNFQNLIAAQSTRLGGVSKEPYSSLNLGKSTADNPEHVLRNRELFFGGLGISSDRIVLSHQVHEDKVLVADRPGNFEGYDAIITNTKNLFPAVSVADCTPVLIYDSRKKAVASVHAGWRGTVKEIVMKTLQTMESHFGTTASDCFAFIGTCIDECSFEVGQEVADEFPEIFKRFDKNKQKYFVDLKAANKAQLMAFGIPESNIEISDLSTILHNDRFFSHRLEKGITGRMMAVIGLK